MALPFTGTPPSEQVCEIILSLEGVFFRCNRLAGETQAFSDSPLAVREVRGSALTLVPQSVYRHLDMLEVTSEDKAFRQYTVPLSRSLFTSKLSLRFNLISSSPLFSIRALLVLPRLALLWL